VVTAPFETATKTLTIAGRGWHLHTLADRQQFHDPAGEYESAGVIPAHWSFFGVTWEAGLALAECMASEPVDGRRILEIGCGLGLPSLVLHARGADITASEIHPLAGRFLATNAALNGLPPLPFVAMDWRRPPAGLGPFDLVIASDVLYEDDQVAGVAAFVRGSCAEHGEFVLADPGRQRVGRLSRALAAAGFDITDASIGGVRLCRYSPSTRAQ